MLYYILLLFVLFINRKDDKTLYLILVVSSTVLFPYHYITDRDTWYAAVCLAECLIIFSAIRVKTASSSALILVSALLLVAHITNYSTELMKTYKSVILFLEHLHLLTFIITSNLVMTIIKRKLQWIVQL